MLAKENKQKGTKKICLSAYFHLLLSKELFCYLFKQ